MYGWIILLLINFLIFCFYSFNSTLLFFICILLTFIWQTKFFKNITFNNSMLKTSELFYIEYLGDFYTINKELFKLEVILKKFNLTRSNYNICVINYELQNKVDSNHTKAIIGILKENENKVGWKEEEFLDYLVKNKFKRALIPETESIVSHFPVSNEISRAIGIKKYFSTLDSSIEDEDFKKKFNIDKKKMKVILVLHKLDSLSFYIPLKNNERFNLLSKHMGNENRKSL
jgi:hypothetical protein